MKSLTAEHALTTPAPAPTRRKLDVTCAECGTNSRQWPGTFHIEDHRVLCAVCLAETLTSTITCDCCDGVDNLAVVTEYVHLLPMDSVACASCLRAARLEQSMYDDWLLVQFRPEVIR